ncbi:PRDX4 protein, partial [Polyodon spathula]|nr:PRDX4 protein [Polyodon spathula]
MEHPDCSTGLQYDSLICISSEHMAVRLQLIFKPFHCEDSMEPLLTALQNPGCTAWEPLAQDPKKEQECYNYAGGHVYPGEAFRVPVSDHSLHLSKAKISKPAPYWEGTAVIKGEFKELKLTDYRGKYLVFFFYPLDFTFVCPTEIIAFSDRVEEFRAIGAEVVACSTDSQFTHLAWINTPRKQGGLGPMKIPLLSDLTHQIAKDYGVYLEDQGHTLRGLFIIDDKGVLRQITMNDLPVGRSVDETLRLCVLQAGNLAVKHGYIDTTSGLPRVPGIPKFAGINDRNKHNSGHKQEHQGLCIVGDFGGQAVYYNKIIPDPSGKLKYFDKLN